MIRISLLLGSVCLFAVVAHPQNEQQEEDKCCCTTYDTGQCLIKVSKKVDAELNATYQSCIERWTQDSNSVDALRKAERAWMAYRDANCGAERATYGFGSMGPNIGAFCRIRLTRERIDEIREGLNKH